MNIDRFFLLLLILFVFYLQYRKHQTGLHWLWKRTKDRIPRQWKPKTPRDRAYCQAGVSLVSLPDPKSMVSWATCKTIGGRKKKMNITGYACPHPQCSYFGITDPEVHALVGYGWID